MATLLKAPLWPRVGLAISLLALVAVGVQGWQGWQHNQRKAEQAKLELKTALVVRQDLTIKVAASGTVHPISPVNISPKQPGRLVSLSVDQGDRVIAGQVLARMDDTNLQGQLLQARGNLAEAQANLRQLQAGNRPQDIQQAQDNLREAQAQITALRSTYESNRALYNSGAISRNELDSSQSAYEAAQARIQSLQQQLSLVQAGARQEEIDAAQARVMQAQGALLTIQTQLNDMVIKAPFTGIITQKYADVGAFVTPTTSASATSSATSSSIVALASDLEAVANVAETDVNRIYAGQIVNLQVDAYPDRTFRGEVRLVAPESVVVQNVTSFQVRIKILDDPNHLLKSGMNLTASFLVGHHDNALVIPTTAIVSQAEGMGVYWLDSSGATAFQPIQVGATLDNETEVLSGLTEGDRVFITFPGQRQPNDKPVKPTTFSPGSGSRPLR
jgi:HlyD family secretion protein